MNILKKEVKLCLACMEEHEVQTVLVTEKNIFKDEEIEYEAIYEYCEHTDEFLEPENLNTRNDISMKNAYRKKMNLLTSDEIVGIRNKYGISQSDLSLILGFGAKTITRYEGHFVQDTPHDNILRKINEDPAWYIQLLKSAEKKLTAESYHKYYTTASNLYSSSPDEYLRKTIQAEYVQYENLSECNGNKLLDLNKVVDIVRYFANSERMKSLFKVKLMKLLWYTDALSYKRTNTSMTGLVYLALPMGAVPVSYKHIIDLDGITYEEGNYDDNTTFHFIGDKINDYLYLTSDDKVILDYVIDHFYNMNSKEISDEMHKEVAYIETAPNDVIQYKYARELSI